MSKNLIVGYTTKDHLLLDLDETSLYDVSKLAILLISEYPEIGNILILASSTPSKKNYTKFDAKGIPQWRHIYQNFHIVTDNIIGYERCLEIIDTLVELDVLQPEYKEIRLFRGDMTLRTSPKPLVHRTVPAPSLENWIKNDLCKKHDGMTSVFLDFLINTKKALSNFTIFLEFQQKSNSKRNPKHLKPSEFARRCKRAKTSYTTHHDAIKNLIR